MSEQTPLAPAPPRVEPGTPPRVRIPQQRTHSPIPPPPRRRLGLVLPLTLATVALIGGAGALAALVDRNATTTTHEIRTPPIAGGLLRDPAAEAAISTRLRAAEAQFRSQFGDRLVTFRAVAYAQPAVAAGQPAGPVVFIGAAINTSGNPEDFVTAFRSGTSGYRVTDVDAGPGAKGVCAESPALVTYCAWSTGDSIGELVPTVPGWDTGRLAALMRTMRPDVEQHTG